MSDLDRRAASTSAPPGWRRRWPRTGRPGRSSSEARPRPSRRPSPATRAEPPSGGSRLVQDAHRCGLAGAVRTEKPEHGARRRLRVDPTSACTSLNDFLRLLTSIAASDINRPLYEEGGKESRRQAPQRTSSPQGDGAARSRRVPSNSPARAQGLSRARCAPAGRCRAGTARSRPRSQPPPRARPIGAARCAGAPGAACRSASGPDGVVARCPRSPSSHRRPCSPRSPPARAIERVRDGFVEYASGNWQMPPRPISTPRRMETSARCRRRAPGLRSSSGSRHSRAIRRQGCRW